MYYKSSRSNPQVKKREREKKILNFKKNLRGGIGLFYLQDVSKRFNLVRYENSLYLQLLTLNQFAKKKSLENTSIILGNKWHFQMILKLKI